MDSGYNKDQVRYASDRRSSTVENTWSLNANFQAIQASLCLIQYNLTPLATQVGLWPY